MNRIKIVSMVVAGIACLVFCSAPYQVQATGYTLTSDTFTFIDVPGATVTAAYGINARGQIVGDYYVNPPVTHGFLDSGGSFTPIDVPGVSTTQAFGINASGQIVGTVFDGTTHGFLYSGASFTPIDGPDATYTYAYGINTSGQIVGYL
jgi:probable HAF family extracellular repeat protein